MVMSTISTGSKNSWWDGIELKIFALLLTACTVLGAGAACADDALSFSADHTRGFQHALEEILLESGLDTINLVAAEADFDNDGRKDVLAFALNAYFCGSGGCGPRMYLNGKKGWQTVDIYALGEPENWSVLDETQNGYRKLAMTTPDEEQIFAWDGSAYVLED